MTKQIDFGRKFKVVAVGLLIGFVSGPVSAQTDLLKVAPLNYVDYPAEGPLRFDYHSPYEHLRGLQKFMDTVHGDVIEKDTPAYSQDSCPEEATLLSEKRFVQAQYALHEKGLKRFSVDAYPYLRPAFERMVEHMVSRSVTLQTQLRSMQIPSVEALRRILGLSRGSTELAKTAAMLGIAAAATRSHETGVDEDDRIPETQLRFYFHTGGERPSWRSWSFCDGRLSMLFSGEQLNLFDIMASYAHEMAIRLSPGIVDGFRKERLATKTLLPVLGSEIANFNGDEAMVRIIQEMRALYFESVVMSEIAAASGWDLRAKDAILYQSYQSPLAAVAMAKALTFQGWPGSSDAQRLLERIMEGPSAELKAAELAEASDLMRFKFRIPFQYYTPGPRGPVGNGGGDGG